jgi:hypothetical protein
VDLIAAIAQLGSFDHSACDRALIATGRRITNITLPATPPRRMMR